MNKSKYKIACMCILGISLFGAMAYRKYEQQKKRKLQSPSIFELGFHIFNKWMKLKHEGKSLQKYFDDNRIKTVAVYGLGALGTRLYEDLSKLDVQVAYAIDRNAANIQIDGLKIVTLEEELEKVDAIIVTPIQFFYEIEADLEKKSKADIISLEDIVEYCI